MIGKEVAQALRECFIYDLHGPDVDNATNGLFAIADAINRLAQAISDSNKPGR